MFDAPGSHRGNKSIHVLPAQVVTAWNSAPCYAVVLHLEHGPGAVTQRCWLQVGAGSFHKGQEGICDPKGTTVSSKREVREWSLTRHWRECSPHWACVVGKPLPTRQGEGAAQTCKLITVTVVESELEFAGKALRGSPRNSHSSQMLCLAWGQMAWASRTRQKPSKKCCLLSFPQGHHLLCFTSLAGISGRQNPGCFQAPRGSRGVHSLHAMYG